MKKNKISQASTYTVLLALTILSLAGSQSSQAQTISVSVVPTVTAGTNGLCPGGYIGVASYMKTAAQGWGWTPTNTVHTATDTNRNDTKIDFTGKFADSGCNQTTVTVPTPTVSTKYRFNVYFTTNVPTNSYSIQLDGFMP